MADKPIHSVQRQQGQKGQRMKWKLGPTEKKKKQSQRAQTLREGIINKAWVVVLSIPAALSTGRTELLTVLSRSQQEAH